MTQQMSSGKGRLETPQNETVGHDSCCCSTQMSPIEFFASVLMSQVHITLPDTETS
jgi:hypothetical protein